MANNLETEALVSRTAENKADLDWHRFFCPGGMQSGNLCQYKYNAQMKGRARIVTDWATETGIN